MPRIFISYRRADSGDMCDRLASQLGWHFGENEVFRDTNTILAGSDFAKAISQGIEDSRVVLVLIGPQWATLADSRGVRLSQLDDYVRREIAEAIRLGKVIVPILIHGATLPPASELPPDIAPLTNYVPLILRPNPWFARDLAEIERRIQPFTRWRPASWVVTSLSIYTIAAYGLAELSVTVTVLHAIESLFNNPAILFGAILVASTILWTRASAVGQWWWNVVAVLITIPFLVWLLLVVYQLSGGSQLGYLMDVTGGLAIPLAGLTGTAAGLFGPRGRQATDALQVRMPALSIVTLIGGITLGLTSLIADTILVVVPVNLIADVALAGIILIGLLAILAGGISGMIRAAMLNRWGWFFGLLFGTVFTAATYAALFVVYLISPAVDAMTIVVESLALVVPLMYGVYLIVWSTGQVSRASRRLTATTEVRT